MKQKLLIITTSLIGSSVLAVTPSESSVKCLAVSASASVGDHDKVYSLHELRQTALSGAFESHFAQFTSWPLRTKIKFLQQWQRLLTETPKFKSYGGIRFKLENEEWTTFFQQHLTMANSLISDIRDASSFGLVVNYLGSRHETLFPADFQPFNLEAALNQGVHYLETSKPSIDEAIAMLTSLPDRFEVMFSLGENNVVYTQQTAAMYNYAAGLIQNVEQLKLLMTALPPHAGTGRGSAPNIMVRKSGHEYYLQEDLFHLVHKKMGLSERYPLYQVSPEQKQLWYKVTQFNFLRAKTPDDFVRSVPWIRSYYSYVYEKGPASIPELLDLMKPLIETHWPRFMSLQPTPAQVYSLAKLMVGRSTHVFNTDWSESRELRKFLVTYVTPAFRSPERVANAMKSLKEDVETNNLKDDQHMDLLFMLQAAIPTANQDQFLESLILALPGQTPANAVDKILSYYNGDRVLEGKAKVIRSKIKN